MRAMDSDDLTERGFGGWFPFSHATERDLLARLPKERGVYAILLKDHVARRHGSSDVAYIGRAANQGGLRQRIRQYFHPGHENWTSLAMKARISDPDAGLRLGFFVTDDAKQLESELLLQFETEHGQLPSFNRQRSYGRAR